MKHLLIPTALLLGALAAPFVRAQAPAGQTDASKPTFEVASIKPNTSGTNNIMIANQPGGRFAATNATLRTLLSFAYRLPPGAQVIGGPSWLNSDHFDIVAKMPAEFVNQTQAPFQQPNQNPSPVQLMMQALLADRFQLVVHMEARDTPIYALVFSRSDQKLGPKIHPSTTDCAALARGRAGQPGPPPMPAFGEPMLCGMRMGPGTLSAGSLPMTQFANQLSGMAQRPVFDRTGLTGLFDVDLTWTPDQMPQGRGDPPPGAPPLPAIDPNGPSLFTAIQEQLGLKLESTRGPVDVLVIDRAEHPTED
jgi:uncharacterized protein (TIGR03435 family)